MTGSRRINLTVKRLLPRTGLREQFLNFLSDKDDDLINVLFQGLSGVVDADAIGGAGDGADHFRLVLTDANRVLTNPGNVITIPDETDVSKAIQFENALGVTYYVGIRYAQVPYGVDVNASTGRPEYVALEDSLGEYGSPTAVVDTPGVKIRINLTSITEAGVDHTGRSVRVCLTIPQSAVSTVAFYTGIVGYAGGINYVDVPYSGGDGPLGQNTATVAPSTTASDYKVFIKGATWRRNTDLRASSTYAFLFTVVGAGAGVAPTTFDATDQRQLFIITLDAAYDGAVGGGAGRRIWVDGGAVKLIHGAAGTGDKSRATLLLNALTGSETHANSLIEILRGAAADTEGGALILKPLTHTTVLQIDESFVVDDAKTISLTRGGVNLTTAKLRTDVDFAWLEGLFTLSGVEKLYRVKVMDADTVELYDITGTAATLTPTETGTVTFLRPVFSVTGSEFGGAGDPGKYVRGVTIVGRNQAKAAPGEAALRVLPMEQDAIDIYDNAATPLPRFRITNTGVLQLLNSADITLGNGCSITLSGTASIDSASGLSITPTAVSASALIATDHITPTNGQDVGLTGADGGGSDDILTVKSIAGADLRRVRCAAGTAAEHAITSAGVLRAAAYINTPLSHAKNGERMFVCDMEEYDVGDMWLNAGVGEKLSAPVNGVYRFDMFARLIAGAVTLDTLRVAIHRSDGYLIAMNDRIGDWPSVAADAYCSTGGEAYLTSAQYAYFTIYDTHTGTNLTCVGRISGYLVART